MNPFDRLHPAVQYHIVNSLGWPRLRPLQQRSIEPVLEGRNVICLAPTAGGKTEAAIFPLLSRLLENDGQGLGILYVCPIKALLNNLHHRLGHYAGLVGRRVALWHGDIKSGDKRRILADPPDILLTTPESIELLLISVRTRPEVLFAGLTTVVVDELHAFAGFDRGWQLLLLIERLARVTERDLQRVGLSATVGNPAQLLKWLSGASGRPQEVVEVPATGLPDPEVTLDYVGGVRNAATVISRLHRGEKRLVFCDSRRQTEELAYELRALGVSTFVSHSSLSVEVRRHAEQAFAKGSNCVIVATSTLELGIDVGDLDRVIQLDAPYTVASFLQRLGRTGRRTGTSRNCLFLATTGAGFLRAGALIRLWRAGYVEPVLPPPFPVQVVAQQMLALCLQYGRLTRGELAGHFRGIPPLMAELSGAVIDDLLVYLLNETYLLEEQGAISIGPAAEKAFGARHYLALLSVFESQSSYLVQYGKAEIGQIQALSLQMLVEKYPFVTLGGRSWRINHVNEIRRVVYVEPSEVKGKSRWFGTGQTLSHAFCQSMKAFVTGPESVADHLSVRGRTLQQDLQEEFAWVRRDQTALVDQQESRVWWNFAGYRANLLAAKRLEGTYEIRRFSDCWIEFTDNHDLQVLAGELISLLQQLDMTFTLDADSGKFDSLLSDALKEGQAKLRLLDQEGLEAVLQQQLQVVKVRV